MNNYSIEKSVGDGGQNIPSDVRIIQTLLNNIPVFLGAPLLRLDIDGLAGPITIGAIRAFQLFHFGWSGADGRIDPNNKTITRINGCISDLRSAQTTGLLTVLQPIMQFIKTDIRLDLLPIHRIAILAIAARECWPNPGTVSDQSTILTENGRKIRSGWEKLRRYFDEGTCGKVEWNCGNIDRIKSPGLRPFDNPCKQGDHKEIHWCGIFAAWVYQQALAVLRNAQLNQPMIGQTHWLFKGGPSNFANLQHIRNKSVKELEQLVRPGDICAINNGYSHHFIALTPPNSNGEMWTLNSNSNSSGNTFYSCSNLTKIHNLRRAGLMTVYSADSIFIQSQ